MSQFHSPPWCFAKLHNSCCTPRAVFDSSPPRCSFIHHHSTSEIRKSVPWAPHLAQYYTLPLLSGHHVTLLPLKILWQRSFLPPISGTNFRFTRTNPGPWLRRVDANVSRNRQGTVLEMWFTIIPYSFPCVRFLYFVPSMRLRAVYCVPCLFVVHRSGFVCLFFVCSGISKPSEYTNFSVYTYSSVL